MLLPYIHDIRQSVDNFRVNDELNNSYILFVNVLNDFKSDIIPGGPKKTEQSIC